MKQLFELSESRGKEASGLMLFSQEKIQLAKFALPASEIVHKKRYKQLYSSKESIFSSPSSSVHGIIGHSRLVTNGTHQVHDNNQPVAAHDIVAVHNGIVTNVDELWSENTDVEPNTQLDTEVLLALIRKNIEGGENLLRSIQNTYDVMEGAASLALISKDYDVVILATNTGSLYLVSSSDASFHIFASEEYILRKILEKNPYLKRGDNVVIQQISANRGLVINLKTLEKTAFSLSPKQLISPSLLNTIALSSDKRNIEDVSFNRAVSENTEHISGEGPYFLPKGFVDAYPSNRDKIANLKRCKKCVLPETMPFINFDDEGICNYCQNYKPINPKGLDALQERLAPYMNGDKKPDSLITFSGGRDSSYGVHFIKTVLGMEPVTYTYDWGMVTDLARRNQMRICGKLGVEHILVSADLSKKRRNIRLNVLAWLKNPDLGTIPLFMAGDKQYFYYANKIAKQTECEAIILCENMLETTHFKSGFCGIAPKQGSEHTYTLTIADKFKLALYYGKQYLNNPSYLNASLLDTIGAYIAYYGIPHNYINLYDYIKFDEDKITNTLVDKYNWETAKDTKSSWRIGDGTASFYNYIYYTMAGLTENDTFRSNQIREGMLSRSDAMLLIERDNQPRYESMQWYCDVIGVDFEYAIKTINGARKLY